MLASGSPRRQQLLEQIGVSYSVHPVQIDESRERGEPPDAMAFRLGIAKARVAASHHAGAVVLAADTVVTLDDTVLGKPRNRADALDKLNQLSGRTHFVHTGVACVAGTRERTALSTSRVTLRPLTEREQKCYWQSGEPAGKAGAYAIQGRAAAFIIRLEGSYSGVMGLPLFETAELLRDLGVDVLQVDFDDE